MPVSHDDIRPMPPGAERTVAGLFGDLARETSRLIRQEVALAKSEVMGKVGRMGLGAAEAAVGGFIAYAGFLVLLAAAVLGLAEVLAAWLAALIVGIVVVAVGAFILLKGRHDMVPGNLKPERTLRTLRDDAEWAREQMR